MNNNDTNDKKLSIDELRKLKELLQKVNVNDCFNKTIDNIDKNIDDKIADKNWELIKKNSH